jgi:hypothetical protein
MEATVRTVELLDETFSGLGGLPHRSGIINTASAGVKPAYRKEIRVL